MKLIVTIAALTAIASAGEIYANQETDKYAHQQFENYAKSAEMYQTGLEHQHQQIVHSEQPAVASIAPSIQHQSRPLSTARIINYVSENDGHNYHYAYETENGIKTQELVADQGKGINTQGAFSYMGDDGHMYTLSYTADENGFRPQGDHLPTPPPIPEAILKALEQNAKDEAAGIYDNGSYQEPVSRYHQHQSEHQGQHYHSSGQPVISQEYAYHGHQ